jgi:outer membrane protein TolC
VDRVHARTLSALYRLRQDVDYTIKASPSLRQAEEAAEQAVALVEAVRAWARDR